MNPVQPIGIAQPQHRGDERAPVAALRAEALVAEHAHQLGKALGDLLDAKARLAGAERKRVARKRRCDHREALGEKRNQLEELDDRSGPAVAEEQRRRVLSPARLVDEMQLDAADRNRELAKAVDARFLRAPVEAFLPIGDDLLEVREALAARPRLEGRLLGEGWAREPRLQGGHLRGGGSWQL